MIDYEYINTRIRAMETELLIPQDLHELIRLGSLSSILEYLRKTSYSPYIMSGKENIASSLDKVFILSLEETMKKVRHICTGVGSDLIDIILGRWDLYNVETLVRGKLRALPPEDIMASLIPAGSLDGPLLGELYKQPSVQAMVDMLITMGHTFVWPLKKFKYASELEMARAEMELEKNFFATIMRRVTLSKERDINKKIVKDILRMLIDRTNLLMVLKAITEGIPVDEMEPYFIYGGWLITPDIYRKMLEYKNPDDAISVIESDIGRTRWNRYKALHSVVDSLFLAERWVDHEILNYSLRLSRRDPFNISVVIGFIWKKIKEITNLRIIIKGIQYGLSHGEIEGYIT